MFMIEYLVSISRWIIISLRSSNELICFFSFKLYLHCEHIFQLAINQHMHTTHDSLPWIVDLLLQFQKKESMRKCNVHGHWVFAAIDTLISTHFAD
jgi:hypothetical protein